MDEIEITECGCPGHYIMADRCRFRRHTQIGAYYRVSTVGELADPDGKYARVNASSMYETMVFRTSAEVVAGGCGCRNPKSLTPVLTRLTNDPAEAQASHAAAIRQFSERLKKGYERG